ncbi:MAG: response regulator transcription factor [Peptostreptococcaceae bacterium]|nr:response regulator transcription factor [Peptostreptococcaceae bacterium]
MKTVLLVEDEQSILENNRRFFELEGWNVLTAETVAQARSRLTEQSPDVIVLDIMLPDGNGLDLLRELRREGCTIPVIMLTAWGKPSDIALGLKSGANDYMSKPFTYEVLKARVEAMIRNVEQMPESIVKGKISLKPIAMTASIGGKDMLLTQKEFLLLLLFVQNDDRLLSAEYIYEKVWDMPLLNNKNALKKHITKIRKKLLEEESGYTITSEYGEGYRLERVE